MHGMSKFRLDIAEREQTCLSVIARLVLILHQIDSRTFFALPGSARKIQRAIVIEFIIILVRHLQSMQNKFCLNQNFQPPPSQIPMAHPYGYVRRV